MNTSKSTSKEIQRAAELNLLANENQITPEELKELEALTRKLNYKNLNKKA